MKNATLTETLPDLTGTPKQVAWATDIRERRLAWMREELGNLDALVGETDPRRADHEAALGRVTGFLAGLLENTDARWWIDTRGSLLQIRRGDAWDRLSVLEQRAVTCCLTGYGA